MASERLDLIAATRVYEKWMHGFRVSAGRGVCEYHSLEPVAYSEKGFEVRVYRAVVEPNPLNPYGTLKEEDGDF